MRDVRDYNSLLDTASIIAQLTAERDRTDKAIKALSGTTSTPLKRGRPKGSKNVAKKAEAPKKRTMSAEGRARIAAARKARWAAARKATTK